MDFRADLHIHSHFSDGTLSPAQILHLAKEKELSVISITDHDTIDAYSDDLFELAKSLNIILLPGVEISAEIDDVTVHILAYDFDLKSEEFISFLKEVQKKRDFRNHKIIEKLNQKNIDITFQELYEFAKEKNIAQTIVGRVHIAQLLKEKGVVSTFQKGFDLYIRDGGPCYQKGYKFSPTEVIDQIKKANGKAVLAHPYIYKNSKILNLLFEMPFDGLEAYYAKLMRNDENRWIKKAQSLNYLITGGSDFHGDNRPYITLGCSWIDENRFNRLIEK